MAWRASRLGALVGLVGGFLLHTVLPVRGGWLAGLVALACVGAGFLCVAWAGTRPAHPLPDTSMDVGAALEKVGTADQVGHGLARAALVLAGFSLGLWLGSLAT
jgi:hypothetical protein